MQPADSTLNDLYLRELERRGYASDASQVTAVAHLETLRQALIEADRQGTSLKGRFLQSLGFDRPVAPRGVYLWGSVGRGKTFLLDLFHESLPIVGKRRSHFHRFMHDVHAELATLSRVQDPLDTVADRIAADIRVLCFDELFVSDIGDAMILGNLFHALIDRGVALVFTSNVPPRDLYRNGLQRQRFLPAIELLDKHSDVVHVGGANDYRLRQLTRASLYLDAAQKDTEGRLIELFETLADGPGNSNHHIEIADRPIPVVREADHAVWFQFAALCDGPRSQEDYIEIARDYQSVLVSDVPVLDELRENSARRFIALVDELYDHGVNLVVSAHAPALELYRGSRLSFEFERTVSRLIEMQSEEYLARPHRA